MGVALRFAVVGNGGKAQSRFVNSGEGGASGNGVVRLLGGIRNGDLGPDEPAFGESWPLLADVR